tara:strand:- start:1591 stop:2394 length:804 start_codon:yes stop_codon:yes gene_type:complete
MKIKFPKKINKKKLDNFFISHGMRAIVDFPKKKPNLINSFYNIGKKPEQPDLLDLYRIFKFITLNKRTTVLEFGSGWSTLVIQEALRFNKINHSHKIKNLRRNNPYELFVLETNKKYLEISKKRINNFNYKFKKNKIKLNWTLSKVKMSEFNGYYCTKYDKFPLCNPDFIYLDGPSQFDVKASLKKFSTAHKDMMPMVGDILAMEFFLIPGTIILTDGRSANAEFIKKNFKRKWFHKWLKKDDQHIFMLVDNSLGTLNDRLIKFYQD